MIKKLGCTKCRMLVCVCNILKRHSSECRFRISATCAIPIECEHGYDVCPICDVCNCGAGVVEEDFGEKLNAG